MKALLRSSLAALIALAPVVQAQAAFSPGPSISTNTTTTITAKTSVAQRPPAVTDDYAAGFRAVGDIQWVSVTKGSSNAYGGIVPTVTFAGCTVNPTGHAMLDTTGAFVSAVVLDTPGTCYTPAAAGGGTTTVPTVAFNFGAAPTPTTLPVATVVMNTTPMIWRDPTDTVWQIMDSTIGNAQWAKVQPAGLPTDVVPYTIATVAINAAGTGYVANEIVTLTDGTKVNVTAVSGGVPTSVTINTAGVFATRPTSITGVAQASTTGSGTGLTINETYNGPNGAWGPARLTASYSGPSFDVRRISDGAVKTIGFVGNLPDDPALCAFLGGKTGTVQRVYEQTGLGTAGSADMLPSGTYGPAVRCDIKSGKVTQFTRGNVVGGPGYPDPTGTSITAGSLTLPTAFRNDSTKVGILLIGRMATINNLLSINQGGLSTGQDSQGSYRCSGNAGQAAPLGAEGVIVNASAFIVSGAPTGTDFVCNNGGTGIVSGYGNAGGTGGTVLGGPGNAMAGLAFWNTSGLNVAQRVQIAAATAQLAGLVPQARDKVVLDGDSMTADVGATLNQGYGTKIEANLALPTRVYYNGGSGNKVADRLLQFDINIRARYQPMDGKMAVFWMAGYNNVFQNDAGTVVITGHQTWASLVHALGPNVFSVGGTIPHTDLNQTSANAIQGRVFNTWLTTNIGGAANQHDAYADMTGTFPSILALPGTVTPNVGFTDGTHPTDTGNALFAAKASAPVNAYFGR